MPEGVVVLFDVLLEARICTCSCRALGVDLPIMVRARVEVRARITWFRVMRSSEHTRHTLEASSAFCSSCEVQSTDERVGGEGESSLGANRREGIHNLTLHDADENILPE